MKLSVIQLKCIVIFFNLGASQETCQKHINELLTKIQLSQEEHEANIKNDLNNLNIDESSFSNILKGGADLSKCEYEADLEKVIYIYI
jgi:hypothetical protein